MDPEFTSDGKPYGPARYREIVQERYYISKYCNTSYNDVGNITPLERQYLLSFIKDEMEKQQQYIVQQKTEMNKHKKYR